MEPSSSGPDWATVLTAVAAAGATGAAVAIPATTFVRRPKLAVREDRHRLHSRVEGNGLPYLRLLVRNGRLRRSAQQARAIVLGYTANGSGAGDTVTLGNPPLGWTSQVVGGGAEVSFLAGEERPIDLGVMEPRWRDMYDRVLPLQDSEPEHEIALGASWQLRLALSHNLAIADQREFLAPRPSGYRIRLLVGSEEGASTNVVAHVNWQGDAPDAQAALASVQIAVVRSRA